MRTSSSLSSMAASSSSSHGGGGSNGNNQLVRKNSGIINDIIINNNATSNDQLDNNSRSNNNSSNGPSRRGGNNNSNSNSNGSNKRYVVLPLHLWRSITFTIVVVSILVWIQLTSLYKVHYRYFLQHYSSSSSSSFSSKLAASMADAEYRHYYQQQQQAPQTTTQDGSGGRGSSTTTTITQEEKRRRERDFDKYRGKDLKGKKPRRPMVSAAYRNATATNSSEETLTSTLLGGNDEFGAGGNLNFTSTMSNEDWFDEQPAVIMFYHVFVPPNDTEGKKHALYVIQQQIGLIRHSYTAWYMYRKAQHRVGSEGMLRIVYNSVGELLPEPVMQEICTRDYYNMQAPEPPRPLSPVYCQLGYYKKRAFEEETLHQFWEYCQTHPHTTVIYLHSKGSYHPHMINEGWRPHLTQGITSEQCLHAVWNENHPCNGCSLQFWPIWNTFFPGNFFMVHCNMVRKLLPPYEFAKVITHVTNQALRMKKRSLFRFKLYNIKIPGILFINRYAAEAWVASHPTLQPCDLSNVEHHDYWWRVNNYAVDESQYFRFKMAPRHPFYNSNWNQIKILRLAKLQQEKELRLREFFLLGGKIYQWVRIYNETPANNSWVWDWYPDGPEWKEAIEKYGMDRAVGVMVRRALMTERYGPKDKNTTNITLADNATRMCLDEDEEDDWEWAYHPVSGNNSTNRTTSIGTNSTNSSSNSNSIITYKIYYNNKTISGTFGTNSTRNTTTTRNATFTTARATTNSSNVTNTGHWLYYNATTYYYNATHRRYRRRRMIFPPTNNNSTRPRRHRHLWMIANNTTGNHTNHTNGTNHTYYYTTPRTNCRVVGGGDGGNGNFTLLGGNNATLANGTVLTNVTAGNSTANNQTAYATDITDEILAITNNTNYTTESYAASVLNRSREELDVWEW